jgi:hypothetical protein
MTWFARLAAFSNVLPVQVSDDIRRPETVIAGLGHSGFEQAASGIGRIMHSIGTADRLTRPRLRKMAPLIPGIKILCPANKRRGR